jgi:hypothetical protein
LGLDLLLLFRSGIIFCHESILFWYGAVAEPAPIRVRVIAALGAMILIQLAAQQIRQRKFLIARHARYRIAVWAIQFEHRRVWNKWKPTVRLLLIIQLEVFCHTSPPAG